jgi:hypothetical protein
MSEISTKTCIGLHVKYPLFLSDFIDRFTFLYRCSKNTQILNFMKIHPMGAELLLANGWTDSLHSRADSKERRT